MWVEKDPGMGIPGTTFTSDFQNTIQEELAGVVEGAGIVLSKANDTQLLAAILALGGAAENKVLNGLMEIWGPAGPGPGSLHNVVSADGTVVLAEPFGCNVGDSPGAATITREVFALATIPPGMEKLGQPRNYMQWDQTVGASSSAPRLSQAIESVLTYAGDVVTFSCVARVTSGTLSVVPRLKQDFGSGGAPSGDVFYTGSAWTFTTSWQRFTYTTTLTGLGGKTLGNSVIYDGRSFLQVRMAFPVSSTFTVQVSDVRLDLGINAIPLWRTRYAEHRLTMRYFEKSYEFDLNIGVLTSGGFDMGTFLFDAARDLGHTAKYRVRKYFDTSNFHAYSPTASGGPDTCRLFADASERDVVYVGNAGDMASAQINIDGAESTTGQHESWGLHWYAACFPDSSYVIPLV